MTAITSHIEYYLHTQNLLPTNSTIIVGLSGGPDSVFLLHMLVALREKYQWNLVAAHLNHGWRTEADAEEEFCKKLCESLQVTFKSAHADTLTLTKKYNGSQEELGRLKRRTFFEQLAQEYQAQAIALAHHADDQIETFFIRLIRGAGVEGLRGMKPQDGLYVRPLLSISKADILHYLHENNLAYCTDASNDSLDYLRNRVRLTVIPALIDADKRFPKACLQALQHLAQADDFIERSAQHLYTQVTVLHDQTRALIIQDFLAQDAIIRQRILLTWLIEHQVSFVPSENFFAEIERFLNNKKSAAHQIHEEWRLIKKNKFLYLVL